MNKCTESTEGWPDEPGDVPPDAEEAFLAHVARCPFHAKTLQADEENIRSLFHRGRGLNTHGRILKGRELRQLIADQDRRHVLLKELAQQSILPFRRVYLGNRGEDIAGSGKFFYFRKYEGDHSLDPEAGLQIKGVIGEGKSTLDVLLGWYALQGVKHTGEEQYLPLENGYTIGLRVKQLSDRDFNIGFRCVEDEILELEKLSAHSESSGVSVQSAAMFLRRTSLRVQSMYRSFRSRMILRRLFWFFRDGPATAIDFLEWGTIWFLILCAGLAGLRLLDGPEVKAGPNFVQAEVQAPAPDPKPQRPRRRNNRSAPPASIQTVSDKNPERSTESLAPQTGEVAGDEDAAPSSDKPSGTDSKADPHAEAHREPGTWYFQSLPPAGITDEGVAIHSGYDKDLMQKLTAEMRKQNITVKRFNRRSSAGPRVAVLWNIIREKTVVTVEATLMDQSDRKFLSFSSAGNCQEQACDDAVRRAVEKVFSEMRDGNRTEPTNSDF